MLFRSLTPVLVLAALAALVAPSARADQLSGGKIALKLKLPPENGGTGFEAPSATYLARYFNFSRCVCDTDTTTKEYEVEYTWDGGSPPSPVPSVDLHPWAGQNCDSDTEATRDANCTPLPLFTAASISTLARVDYDLRDLVARPVDVPRGQARRPALAGHPNRHGVGRREPVQAVRERS
ncbi:MAG: hypothetical protein R3B06_13020 [Kofleriaceae bacterium]